VLPGRRVIEVRARGINKGSYVQRLLAAEGDDEHGLFLAAGDDVTDIDLFRALPDDAIAIHVGVRRKGRRVPLEREYVVGSPRALRTALRGFTDELHSSLDAAANARRRPEMGAFSDDAVPGGAAPVPSHFRSST
jgi:trehalose-6-phosphatase